MKIRTLIVDDEPLARKRVRSLLSTDSDIEIVGECGDGVSAVSGILDLRPDLVFLDVQMPELDGFGVLEAVVDQHAPLVIFVTAFDRYAVKAFESHALDYLLKPFKRHRFFEAVRRAKEQLQAAPATYGDKLNSLLEKLKPSHDRLVFKSAGKIVVIRPGEVDWVEAAANYVRIHVGSQEHAVRDTISNFEKKLPADRFLRIHRSVIVNADRIHELQPCNGAEYIVVLRSGKELPVGRTYRDQIENFLHIS